MIENKDISNTTVTAGYITDERKRTNERFDDIAEDSIFMIGAVNKSIPGTKLSAYYYYVDDHHNKTGLYLDAKTKVSLLNLAAQYVLIDPDESGTDETNTFGAKVSADLGIFELTGAACTTDDGTERAAKFSDNGTKTPLYTATISGDGDIAGAVDTDSFKGSIAVKPLKGLKVTASYGYYHHGTDAASAHKNAETFELAAKYSVNKNITLFAAYFNTDHYNGAWQGNDEHENLNAMRFWAKYVF